MTNNRTCYFKFSRIIVLGLFAVWTSVISACTPTTLRRDAGDILVERLRIGMTEAEATKAIGNPEAVGTLGNEASISYLYVYADRFPYDLFSRVPENASYWRYSYAVGPHTDSSLRIFFDQKSHLLIGWAKEFGQYTRDKFTHERLTSQLKLRMSHADVQARIGSPAQIIDIPPKTRSFYEGHYWTRDPYGTLTRKLEIYVYRISDNIERRVYLAYRPNADMLDFWGYDHAWQEAERYMREQAAQKK